MGKTAVLLAIALGVLIPETGHAAAAPKWTNYERPATFEVVRDDNVPVRMSDGMTLRANVELQALRRHCAGHCKPLPVPELIRGG